jgi:hypothetical protein
VAPVATTTKSALPHQHPQVPYTNSATNVHAIPQHRSGETLGSPFVGGRITKRRHVVGQSNETNLLDGLQESDFAKNDSGNWQADVRERSRDYADWCPTLPPDHELFQGQATLPRTSLDQLSTAESVPISTCAASADIVNPYAKRKCHTLPMESSTKESFSDCSTVIGPENKVERFLDDDGGGKSGVKGRMSVFEPVPPLESLAVTASRLAVRPAVEQATAVDSLVPSHVPKNNDGFPHCLVHFPLGRLRTRPKVSFSWLGDGVIEVNESLGRHYYVGFKLKGVEFYKGDVVRLGIENEEFPFGQTYRRRFIIVSAFQATKSFLGRYGKTANAEIQHRGMKDNFVWIVLLSTINQSLTTHYFDAGHPYFELQCTKSGEPELYPEWALDSRLILVRTGHIAGLESLKPTMTWNSKVEAKRINFFKFRRIQPVCPNGVKWKYNVDSGDDSSTESIDQHIIDDEASCDSGMWYKYVSAPFALALV